MVRLRAALAAWLLAMAATGAAHAVTGYELHPSKDTSIFSDSEFLSDGAGPNLWLSTTGTATNRRALIEFDFASIPVGAVVTDVTLTLFVSRANGPGVEIALHRLLEGWGEGASNGANSGGGAAAQPGDATWGHRYYDGDRWANAGGYFEPLASAAATVGDAGTLAVWSATPRMVADVQAWIDDPASNFGWILVGGESSAFSGKRLGSRQNSDAAQWPRLEVTIAVVPEPSAWLLMLTGLAALGFYMRRRRG